MVKFFLGLAIVAICSLLGYVLSSKYRQRKQFYVQLRMFNERFLHEISYYKRPLGEFIAKYTYQGQFDEVLHDFYKQLATQKQRHISFDFAEYTFLQKEEHVFLEDYFQMIGKGDSSSQKVYFSSMKEEIQKRCTTAETEYKKYGDLYIKLGFLCGLFILVLII